LLIAGGRSVTLGEKLKALRELEGLCRGRSRGLSKAELATLIHEETGGRISVPYLSQLETGRRLHMTNKTRLLLARFFRIHPGYLVDDPPDFQEHLAAPVRNDPLGAWLRAGALRFRHDATVSEALDRLAGAPDRRRALELLGHLLAVPGLLDKLLRSVEPART
jgi:transcriptional regulator with XRE-family HTH domain